MENKILLVSEVSSLLRVSESTINRWCEDARKGNGCFPAPISARGGKRRWTRDSIEAFIDSQSTAAQTPPTARKRSRKAFAERQAATDQALARWHVQVFSQQ